MAHQGPTDDHGLPRGYPFRPEYEVTPREAKVALEAGRAVVVDCRTGPEWEFAHVPGTVHIPLDEIEKRADEIEAGGREVLVICHHGVRSMKGALALRALGHPGAKSVAGGIDSWSLAADPAVRRYERAGGVITPV